MATYFQTSIELIELIMSEKSKEEMQLESVRYMIADKHLMEEYLQRKNQSEQGRFSHLSYSASECKPSYNCKCDHGKIMKYPQQNDKCYYESFTPREAVNREGMTENAAEKITRKPSRKRSKYADVDFSRIYREPKSSKYKRKSETTTEIENPLDSEIDISEKSSVGHVSVERNRMAQNVTTGKGTDNMRRIIHVRQLLNKLIHSKTRKGQDDILRILRSDEALRETFIREASSLGKVKIPVYKYHFKMNEHHIIPDDAKGEFDSQSTGTFELQGEAFVTNYDNKTKPKFHPSKTNTLDFDGSFDHIERDCAFVQHFNSTSTTPNISAMRSPQSVALNDARLSDATEHLNSNAEKGTSQSVWSISNGKIHPKEIHGICTIEDLFMKRLQAGHQLSYQKEESYNKMRYLKQFDEIEAIN